MTVRYFTTPIYYVNDRPHIGHAYTTVLADVAARYARRLGHETTFLTGTDEHGQKVQQAAAARGLAPRAHVDELHVAFRAMCENLGTTHDRFIRTTDADHVVVVQGALQRLWDQGLIESRRYGGWYSVSEERFFPEKDLVEGKDPVGKKPVEWVEEENFFFKMSLYRERLIAHIEGNPGCIVPAYRAQEVLGFLRQPLEDLCISRPKTRLAWGIELPFAKDYVTYVWFDALLNYLTGIGYPDGDWRERWAESTHLIGKDILTTHTVYWWSMLMALEVPVPKRVLAHGWWLMGDAKMSKSSGNVVSPLGLADVYGVDVFRYFLLREMVIGQDASFSEEALVRRNNAELADDLGNLVNRVLSLVERRFDNRVPEPGPEQPLDVEVLASIRGLEATVSEAVEGLMLHKAVDSCAALVRRLNRYVNETVPFTVAKTDLPRAGAILHVVLSALAELSWWLEPVMPRAMAELRRRLGADGRSLVAGASIDKGAVLFPKHELPEAPVPAAESPTPTAAPPAPPAAPAPQAPQEGVALIGFDDFAKVALRVAEVLVAERVKGSDKLLRLEVDLGSERRQIVAGIAKAYAPEQLVGKRLVVVANLAPRKIFGLDSQGMVLAAKHGDALVVLCPDGPTPSGATVS